MIPFLLFANVKQIEIRCQARLYAISHDEALALANEHKKKARADLPEFSLKNQYSLPLVVVRGTVKIIEKRRKSSRSKNGSGTREAQKKEKNFSVQERPTRKLREGRESPKWFYYAWKWKLNNNKRKVEWKQAERSTDEKCNFVYDRHRHVA